MRPEPLAKKLRNLEIELQKKTHELEKSRLESENLYIALDEAYKKLRELYPYIELLQEDKKEKNFIH